MSENVTLLAWIARHCASIESIERDEFDGAAWWGYRVTIPEPYARAEADCLATAILAAARCAGVDAPDVEYAEEW